MILTNKDLKRFENSYLKSTDGCWLWVGSKSKNKNHKIPYGYFSYKGKKYGAHRVMWEQTNGQIPEGKHVLHKCDNPPCVNPDHLFLGDQIANMADMRSKNRQIHGKDHWICKFPEKVKRGKESFSTTHPERMLRGIDLPQHKLCPEDVKEIRKMLLIGMTQESIAEKYGVHRTCISGIAIKRTWKHVL